MTYGVPSVGSFTRHCEERSDVAIFSFQGKTKAPQKCGANTKTQNIDDIFVARGDINILAFFQVVASGQISPHFRGAKIYKFSDMQTFSKSFFDKWPLFPMMSKSVTYAL